MTTESLNVTIDGETLTVEIGTVAAPAGGGASVHADLTGRDANDSHPMSAITGLAAALAGKETSGAVATHNSDTSAHGQTATGRALVTAVSTAAARTAIGLGNVDNTSDANKPISTATQTALDGKQSTAEKGSANGYPSLDSSGKIPQAQLPSIAITEYLGTAADQAAMLALSGQKGDWCIRTDSSAVWIITGTDPALLGSWTAVSYPASPVTSVAGRTGDVTVSAGDVSGLSTVATTGAYADLSGLPTLGTAAATDATAYATAAQGTAADTAVQPARTISAAGLATGGGDLSANRTITVTAAAASDVNTGTSTSTAMTPGSYKGSTPYYVNRAADWTLAQSDANTEQQFNSGSPLVCTIDTNANVPIDVQTMVPFLGVGAGTMTIDAVAGVTINDADGASVTLDQYQFALARKVGTDAWIIGGVA